MHYKKEPSKLFLMTENPNCKKALDFWLRARKISRYETGKDKKGDFIIRLLNEKGGKTGIIVCLCEISEQDALHIVDDHLAELKAQAAA